MNYNNKILFHTCCAPCSIKLIKKLNNITILFYNPNIHPYNEYEKRKLSIIEIATKMNIPFIDCDYEKSFWFKKIKKYSFLKEKNKRCTICFDIRLKYTAFFAYKYGFKKITSSIGISNKKNLTYINSIGLKIVKNYKNLDYLTYNKKIENNYNNNMYFQNYCGCIFSKKTIY